MRDDVVGVASLTLRVSVARRRLLRQQLGDFGVGAVAGVDVAEDALLVEEEHRWDAGDSPLLG